MLNIRKIDENKFEVDVIESVETVHTVTLDDDYYRRITSGNVSKEQLIEESFNYLLERESNTSILSEFALQTIEQYFPDYSSEIKGRFTL